jgi:hypothetical protein
MMLILKINIKELEVFYSFHLNIIFKLRMMLVEINLVLKEWIEVERVEKLRLRLKRKIKIINF